MLSLFEAMGIGGLAAFFVGTFLPIWPMWDLLGRCAAETSGSLWIVGLRTYRSWFRDQGVAAVVSYPNELLVVGTVLSVLGCISGAIIHILRRFAGRR